jgi:16S rRNA (cytosine1402-N4)-methyltransferase
MTDAINHEPVLLDEVVGLLGVRPGGVYIDGTLGGGGHAGAIVAALAGTGTFIGLDRDAAAVARAADRLAAFSGVAISLVQGNFDDMKSIAKAKGVRAADGILLDLGVSSYQLDTAERGFSFARKGPLDMRMDTSAPLTAAELVNAASEADLAQMIRDLGEEPRARRVAAAIVRRRAERTFETTDDLADVVSRAVGGRRGPRHPATKTFQALRIAVNDELGSISRGLEAAIDLLVPGGRLAVIAFHSLEDRDVKQCFRRHAGRWESLAAGGEAWVGEEPRVRHVTRKPVSPGNQEVARNPRARSARLRVIERLQPGDGRVSHRMDRTGPRDGGTQKHDP